MRWLQSLPFLFTVLLFSACGPRDAVVEAPLPTNTPFPTFTSTPVGAAPAASGGQAGSQTQVQPAATPVPPAASATPEQPMVTIGNVLMNVRGGPGTNYHVIGTASPSEKFVITGKNPGLGDWWQIDFSRPDRVGLRPPGDRNQRQRGAGGPGNTSAATAYGHTYSTNACARADATSRAQVPIFAGE